PKGGIHLLEQAARVTQLMALQVHPRERGERGRAWVLALRLLPVACGGRRRLAGQLGGAGHPAAQGLHQREMAKAANAFVLVSGGRGGGPPRIEDTGRLAETARP